MDPLPHVASGEPPDAGVAGHPEQDGPGGRGLSAAAPEDLPAGCTGGLLVDKGQIIIT